MGGGVICPPPTSAWGKIDRQGGKDVLWRVERDRVSDPFQPSLTEHSAVLMMMHIFIHSVTINSNTVKTPFPLG